MVDNEHSEMFHTTEEWAGRGKTIAKKRKTRPRTQAEGVRVSTDERQRGSLRKWRARVGLS